MSRLFGSLMLLTAGLVATPAAATPSLFGVEALNDSSLSQVRGTYASPGFARNARAAIDQSARSSFDAMASINRVTFDNWFAREGADLIAAGALGRPLP